MPLPSIPVCTRIDEFGYPVGLPETVEGRWTKRPGVEGYEYFQITTRRNPPPYSHGQFICKRRIGGERPLTYYTEYENARKGILNSINTLEAKKNEIAMGLKELAKRYVVPLEEIKQKQEAWFRERAEYLTQLHNAGQISDEEYQQALMRAEEGMNGLTIGIEEGYFPSNEAYLAYSRERAGIIKERIIPLEHEIQRQLNTLIELDDRYMR